MYQNGKLNLCDFMKGESIHDTGKKHYYTLWQYSTGYDDYEISNLVEYVRQKQGAVQEELKER